MQQRVNQEQTAAHDIRSLCILCALINNYYKIQAIQLSTTNFIIFPKN